MKTNLSPTNRRHRAFTLVELLVVMAVIATLAAILFPAFGAIKKKSAIKRAQSALKLVATAIESYKGNLNLYPPDNPDNPALNPLYYELVGTTSFSGNIYLTDSGQGLTNVSAFFGPKVTGLVNVSRGAGDEAQKAKNFIVGIRSGNYLEIANGSGLPGTVLGITLKGPLMLSDASGASINPVRYVSTNPTNNAGHYDLWVDILVGGKTNRISNWSEKADPISY